MADRFKKENKTGKKVQPYSAYKRLTWPLRQADQE